MSEFDNVDDEIDRRALAEEQIQHAQQLQELRAQVSLADEVQRFLASGLCQRMESDALRERAALLNELADLDPDDDADRKRIRAIRLDVAALERWKVFLAQYTEEGNTAFAMLNEITGPT